ncbi:MAG: hypothetical protein GYB65_18070 [Chloroflexi bacterium]|nr:hypothetical protein [Chloroflexota bacterium]
MSFAVIVIAMVLAGGVSLLVLVPLMDEKPGTTTSLHPALEALYTEKRRVLRAIRDLDFDYDLGKIASDAYHVQRIHLIRLGVAIMQRIDALEDDLSAKDTLIEEAVSAYRDTRQRELA